MKDFVIGNGTNVSAMENDTLEEYTNGQYNDSDRIVCSTNQYRVTGGNIDDKIRKVVENAVTTVEICLQDSILTAMDKTVIPRVEMAVRSITIFSWQEHNSVVQNLDSGISQGIPKILRSCQPLDD